jgi:hypothetical protein
MIKGNKLLNLAIGELVACSSFIVAFSILDLGIVSLISLVFLVFVLIQGSIYWLLRYKLTQRKQGVNPKAIKLFAFFKKINLILSVLLPIFIPIFMETLLDLWIGIGIYLLAVIEYINYYWYRLSYGKTGFNIRILLNKGLKKSSIRKLIENNR